METNNFVFNKFDYPSNKYIEKIIEYNLDDEFGILLVKYYHSIIIYKKLGGDAKTTMSFCNLEIMKMVINDKYDINHLSYLNSLFLLSMLYV
mgnify:FL=1|jgi:hypothetical protein